MKNAEVIRAWKNADYRLSLSRAERDSMPEHPAGHIELTDEELGGASGGIDLSTVAIFTAGQCCLHTDFCTVFEIGCYNTKSCIAS